MHSFAAILIVAFAAICCRVQAGVISSDVSEKCRSSPNKKVDVMIALPSVDNTLPQLKSGEDIATRLGSSLKTRTSVAQEPIIAALKAINPNFDIRTFWIANRIAIKGVRCSLFPTIAAIPGVFTIRSPVTAKVGYIAESLKEFTEEESSAFAGDNQWGVKTIRAPEVWPETKGKGVVVGMIDTGVRGTHEALRDNFKGEDNFGWLDGFTNSSLGLPKDGHGHGSHVMGSICGQLGIGVAPGATWMACSGCDAKGGCEEEPLLTCGQFMFCPYKQDESGNLLEEDCTQRPRVCSNSWGALIGPSDFYNEVIANWQIVGIVPVFAIGNSGPFCGTTGSPGNQMSVISVGATDNKDKIAKFSSRGPGLSGITKPEVSAPGKDIYSAWYKHDKAYSTISGTSMAAPHVSGAVALLLSKYPSLLFPEVEKAFEESAFRTSGLSPFETCSFGSWPNNAYGYGRIDMPGAFMYAQELANNDTSSEYTTEGRPTF